MCACDVPCNLFSSLELFSCNNCNGTLSATISSCKSSSSSGSGGGGSSSSSGGGGGGGGSDCVCVFVILFKEVIIFTFPHTQNSHSVLKDSSLLPA